MLPQKKKKNKKAKLKRNTITITITSTAIVIIFCLASDALWLKTTATHEFTHPQQFKNKIQRNDFFIFLFFYCSAVVDDIIIVVFAIALIFVCWQIIWNIFLFVKRNCFNGITHATTLTATHHNTANSR